MVSDEQQQQVNSNSNEDDDESQKKKREKGVNDRVGLIQYNRLETRRRGDIETLNEWRK